MSKFYPRIQLSIFKMEDYKREIFGKSFICELKDKTFECIVKNIIPSQPDNLPYSIEIKIVGGQNEEIPILSIEKLTLIK